MRVAIIINTSWNIFNFRKGIVSALINRGDEVIAIAPQDDYSEIITGWGCKFVPIEISGTGMNPIKDGKLYFALKKILRRESPDVIVSYTIKPNIYASIASAQLKIPCICNVSGLGTVFLRKGMLRTVAITLYNFAFRYNKWIFFQNPDDQDEFLSNVKIAREKTSLLPGSGVDIDTFEYSPFSKGEDTVVLMIARLIIEKGIRDYIEAIKIIKVKYPKVRFRLLGSLDEGHVRSITKDELNEWIEAGLIDYKDHQEDVRSEIALAELVVLPSYREGTPRTLLEAGAMGKALLATDVPGCRHVVQDGENGFLFCVQNPADFAEKIQLYLSLSHDDRKKMSVKSREVVASRFDEKIVVRKYLDKIDELTS